MAPIDPAAARRNWMGWMYWYMATHQDEVPTKTELAKRLDVGKSAVTPLLDPRGTRAPSMATLLRSSDMTGFPIDVLLRSPPPAGAPAHPSKRGAR
jgi:hypothetical protein